MALTQHSLPSTPEPATTPTSWLMTRYQLVANAMMAGGDWARAAEYEERAVRLEHQIELAREPRATESRA